MKGRKGTVRSGGLIPYSLLLSCLLLFFLPHTTFAQTWARTYGDSDSDKARSIQQTSDGGFIVAGESGGDFWVLKLDASGNVSWQKTYGGGNVDEAYSIQQTADGGYVVAGSTQSFGEGSSDAWVLKLDASGNVEWDKTYGGASYEEAFSIRQTSDGGFVVAGRTGSFGAGSSDVWVLKLDALGNVLWQKTFGGSSSDYARSIQQISDGGFVVAGRTQSFGAGWADFWILKLDASGNIQWQKTYGSADTDYANSIQQTSDGGFIVTGSAHFGALSSDFWVLKLDASGNVTWQKTFGGTLVDMPNSIQQTTDGGYVVAGGTYSFGAGDWDYWILKLDASGNVSWQKTYGGATWDEACSIQQTLDNGFVVAGYTDTNPSAFSDDYDFWVLKLDANGEIDASCSFISDTFVTGVISAATVTTTPVIGVTSAATVTNTSVTGVDSVATVVEQCVAGGCPVLSCTAGADVATVCQGTAQTFTVTPIDGIAPYTYEWDFSYNGVTFNVEGAGDTIVYTQPATGSYTVAARVTDSCAKGAQTTICTVATTVTTSLAPTITSSPCSGWNVTLDANPSGGTPPYTYLWDTGATTQTITVAGDGAAYSVTETDANGCQGSDSHTTTDCSKLTWARIYGGADRDIAYSTQQTSDGGFVVAGYSDSFVGFNANFWVLKLDASGTVTWQKTYGGSGWDEAYSIQQTSDDGFVVAGYTGSFGPGSYNFWVLKLDASGNVSWQKAYGGNSQDIAYSIKETSDGGFIVAGYASSYGAGNRDYWVLKLDASGNVQWQKSYGGSGYDEAHSIQQTADGGYIVAGEADSFGPGSDFWVLKLDALGNVSWQKTYNGNMLDTPYSIKQTSDGGFIVAGGGSDIWVLKLDTSGNVQWQKTYGGADWDEVRSIQQTTDSGYVVAGSTEFCCPWRDYFWVLKLDASGNVSWQKAYGSGSDEKAWSIQQTTDGGYVVAGPTGPVFEEDFLVVKLDANGEIDPSCPFIVDTSVTGVDSGAVPANTAVSAMNSTAPITNTSATGVNSSATVIEQCAGSGCPALSCTAGVDTATVCQGISQTFTATPVDGVAPYAYEWDFSYDGVTFNVEDTGNPVSYTQPATGSYTVRLRVTDSCILGSTVAFADVPVTVNPLLLAVSFDAVFDPVATLAQVCGDGDFIVEPGEEWQVTVQLINNAAACPANNVKADLTVNLGSAVAAAVCNNPGVYGNIPAGGTAQFTYSFVVDAGAVCINNLTFDVTGIVSDEGVYPGEIPAFTVQVGTINPGPTETATQATDPLTEKNGTISSDFTPAFTLAAPVASSTLSYTLSGGTDLVACVEVALVDALGTATVVKPLGAADANPYDVTALYTGPGTYQLQLTEEGKGCGGGGSATLTAGVLSVTAPDVTECDVSTCLCPCPVLSCTAGVDAAAVCQGTAQTFTATPSGGIAPYAYEWDFSYDGVTFNVEGAGNPIVYTQPAAGSYTVAARVADSCATGAQTTICTVATTVNANPVCAILPGSAEICDGTSISFCGSGPPGATYQWDFEDDGFIDETTVGFGCTSAHLYPGPGVYTVRVWVTDANGCTATCTATVTVNANPASDILPDAPARCAADPCTALDANPSGGTPPYTYFWSTGATSQTICVAPAATTTYDVTVVDAIGCAASSSETVTVANPAPDIGESACSGGMVTLDAGAGYASYLWSTGATTQTITVLGNGASYDVTVTDANSCPGSDSHTTTDCGAVTWARTYGGAAWERAYSIEQTTDGGFIVAGETSSFGAGGQDFWVLKLDASSTVEWQKAYGGAGVDVAFSIQQTTDGGYVVAGPTQSFGAGGDDFWVLKLDASGNVTWQKTYGGAGTERARSIQQTTDGGFIVGGFGGAWLLKLDASGNVQWQKAYSSASEARSIQQTTDGGYAVAGYIWGAGFYDFWILKLDASGSVQWQKAYGGADYDYVRSVQQTTDGGFVMAGWTKSFGAGGDDFWVLKLDASGNVTWQKTYGGAGTERAHSVQQTTDGGFVVAGETTSFGAGGFDSWVLKLGANGEIDPSCTFIADTAVTGVNSGAVPADTAVPAVNSAALISNTAVTGVNSTATVDEQCSGGGCPALSCAAGVDAATVCQGTAQTFTVTPSGGTAPYVYEWDFSYDGVTFNVESAGNPIAYTQPAAGSYTVAARVTDSCGTVAQVTICTVATTVNANPAPTIAESVCSGGMVTLDAGAGYAGYLWSTGATTQTITVAGEGSAYGVTVTDATGCSGSGGWTTTICGGGALTWARTYGGVNWDSAYSIQQTTDGGYVVAGRTNSFGAGNYDFWVLKLNASGNVSWQKTYGGASSEVAWSIQQTTDGGFVVAGWTGSFGVGNSDFWVLKLDASGNIQWQKTYGGADSEGSWPYGQTIRQTTDGGFIVAGQTKSFGFGAGGYDIWVLKLDASGNVQWQKTYGGAIDQLAYSIWQTSDGGYIVAGSQTNDGAGNGFWVLKLDASGNVQWLKIYHEGLTTGAAYAIQQTTDGGFVVAGAHSGGFWVLKLDASGNVQWQKIYDGAAADRARSIQQTTDGGFVVAGLTNSDFWVLKLDASGNIQWQKTYGGAGSEGDWRDRQAIQQTTDGGFVVAGLTESFGAGNADFWVLKLDANGEIDPSCAFISDTTATAMDTSATITITGMVGAISAASVVNTSVTGVDSAAIVTLPCVPFLAYNSHVFTDCGNADGAADPGETIDLNVTVLNTGSEDFFNINGVLSTITPGITITANTAAFPDIPTWLTGASLTPFQFIVDLSVPCGTLIDFTLDLTYTDAALNPFSNAASFQVQAGSGGTLLSENFNTGLPGTWTVVDGGSGPDTWTDADPCARGLFADTYMIVDSDCALFGAVQDELLITPLMDASSVSAVTLQFDHDFKGFAADGANDDFATVRVRSALTGGVWTDLIQWDETQSDIGTIILDATLECAGAADCQFGFRYEGAYDWYWGVDNVVVDGTGGCSPATCGGCPALSCTAGVDVATVCQGTAQTFTVTPGGGSAPYAYEWDFSYDGVTFNVEGAGNPIVYTQPAAGSYTVAARVTDSCVPPLVTICTVATTVNANPVQVILESICDCLGNVVLDANPSGGAVPYSYLWSTGATTQTITVAGDGAAYSVTVQDGNGCFGSDNHTTSLCGPCCITSATATALGPTTFCAGDTVDLSAAADDGTGPFTYLWSPGGATTAVITAIASGTYSCDVTDNDPSCGNTVTTNSIVVTVNASPAPDIGESACSGGNVTLDAGAGYASYLWSTGATTQTITVAGDGAAYNVTVTDATSGCPGTDSHATTVCTAPSLVYSSHTFTDCGNANGVVDPGETIDLDVTAQNTGSADAFNVSGVLSTLTPGITITANTAAFPDIPAGLTGVSLTSFQFVVDLSVPCGTLIDFTLDLTYTDAALNPFSNTTSFQVQVSAAGPVTFLSEDFNLGLPGTWTVVDGGNGPDTWTDADPCARGLFADTYMIVDSDCALLGAIQDEELITPLIDASSAGAVTLQFDHDFLGFGMDGANDDFATVRVRSTLTGGAWTDLIQWDENDSDIGTITLDATADCAGAADCQFGWRYEGAYDWYWGVDNVVVDGTAGCNPATCGGVPLEPSPPASLDPLFIPTTTADQIIVEDVANETGYVVYENAIGTWYGTPSQECLWGTDIVDLGATVQLNYLLGVGDRWVVVSAASAAGESSCGMDSTAVERNTSPGWPVPGPCP